MGHHEELHHEELRPLVTPHEMSHEAADRFSVPAGGMFFFVGGAGLSAVARD